MSEEKMTPQEVATFWFKKSTELEAKLTESEDMRRNLANDFGDLKNKYTALELVMAENIKKLEDKVDRESGRACQAENSVDLYQKRWRQTWDELQATKLALADIHKQIEKTNFMTYEQIVDLKCENKRLTEQLAKFTKWQRLLDKIKIF